MIYALYPESFCDKKLAIRKVFAFCDSALVIMGEMVIMVKMANLVKMVIMIKIVILVKMVIMFKMVIMVKRVITGLKKVGHTL